jgi:hypothetical protein
MVHAEELPCTPTAFGALIKHRAGKAALEQPAHRWAGRPARIERGPAIAMSRKISDPQSGRVGNIVNVISRYGQVERAFVVPRNPRAPGQQQVRSNFARVTARWRILTHEQHVAWQIASADSYTTNRLGPHVALNGYNYFCRINLCRADLGLDLFDLPPAVPTFNPNPVEELQITNQRGVSILKLRVPSPPAQYTIVQGASPRSPGVTCVQHFPNLGFLPAPSGGWSDITELYVDRYGVLPVGRMIWIRTRQHIDGWNDLPKQTGAVVPAP